MCVGLQPHTLSYTHAFTHFLHIFIQIFKDYSSILVIEPKMRKKMGLMPLYKYELAEILPTFNLKQCEIFCFNYLKI